MVSPDQALLLQTGLRVEGVEALGEDLGLFADFLQETVQSDEPSREVPPHLQPVMHGLAKVVIGAEIKHTEGLVRQGAARELGIRTQSTFGLPAKIELLGSLIGS